MTAADRSARIAAATAALAVRLGDLRPGIAIVLGSGLGHLAERVRDAIRIPYAEIPGFHQPTVEGHRGELVVGSLAGRMVVVQSGRFHMYEGHSADEAALPVRVFASLGVRALVVTNAAGGINRRFAPGTVMLIRDHINLTGRTPLEGPALPGEERFPDMSAAYDAKLRTAAREVALKEGLDVAEGVYAGLVGPSYETPAEVRMLRTLGADAVGMSMVLEAIAGRWAGLRLAGISLVTNPAAGVTGEPLSHEEVLQAADEAAPRFERLVTRFVSLLSD